MLHSVYENDMLSKKRKYADPAENDKLTLWLAIVMPILFVIIVVVSVFVYFYFFRFTANVVNIRSAPTLSEPQKTRARLSELHENRDQLSKLRLFIESVDALGMLDLRHYHYVNVENTKNRLHNFRNDVIELQRYMNNKKISKAYDYYLKENLENEFNQLKYIILSKTKLSSKIMSKKSSSH